MRNCIHKDRMPLLRIMRVTGSSFSGNLIFIDMLVTYKSKIHSEVVLTLSPITAKIMIEKLTKELNKTELKGGKK